MLCQLAPKAWGVSVGVYLTHSHPGVYERLVERAKLDGARCQLVSSREEADIILYIEAPRRYPDARDPLISLRPRDLARTYVFSQADDPIPWAPGVYASIPASRATAAVSGGFYVPPHYGVPGGLTEYLDAVRHVEPDVLWGFAGTVSNHLVRQQLAALSDARSLVEDTRFWNDQVRWGWRDRYRREVRTTFSRYAKLMSRCAFVACPRGVGPSSIRLFEALEVGRCPVIISDEWLPPSFVDWEACSIRIPEGRVRELPAILRAREQEAAVLGAEARRVWEQFFAPERQLNTLAAACLVIREQSPRRMVVLGRGLMSSAAKCDARGEKHGSGLRGRVEVRTIHSGSRPGGGTAIPRTSASNGTTSFRKTMRAKEVHSYA